MYCASCGSQITETLSYCNRCGASLKAKNSGEAETAKTTIDTLVWVIVGTTITLLGMAFGSLVLMKNGAIDSALGTALVIMSFLALVLVEGVLVWRLLQLNKKTKESSTLAQLKDSQIEESGPASARTLPEHLEPVPSVTEQTTRALEPSYTEGRKQRKE